MCCTPGRRERDGEGEEGGRDYLVMEYLEGQTLAEKLTAVGGRVVLVDDEDDV